MRVLVAVSDEYQRGKMVARYRNARCAVTVVDDVSDIAIARGDLDGLAEGYDLIVASEGLGAIFNRAAPGPGIAVVSPGDTLAKAFTTVARAHGHESHNLVIQQGKNTLELDMLTGTCRVNEQTIDLRPKEHQLLLKLVLLSGKSEGRENLQKALGTSDEGLNTCLKNLRQRIAPLKITQKSGSLSMDNEKFPINVRVKAEKNGIILYDDGRILCNGREVKLALNERENLAVLLNGSQLEITPAVSTSISRIRKALAKASHCKDAPDGYDFIKKTTNSTYALRNTTVNIPPRHEPSLQGMILQIGDQENKLRINTKQRTICLVNNNRETIEEKINVKQAAFFEHLARQQLINGVLTTASSIEVYLQLPDGAVSNLLRGIYSKIRRLGADPQLFITAGQGRTSPGYTLINLSDLTESFARPDNNLSMD